jgi:energy-coupling factor transporter ATP-binding protein EcfA2
MRGIRLSDRVLIAGQTGMGKTTLAAYLVERMQPVRTIVFDPKDELSLGVAPCRTPEQLAHCMREPLIHYVPASFERDQLEEACQIVWNTPGPYVWWVDEAAEVSNANYCPEGLALCVKQGRGKEKLVLALTQRLAEIHPVFRSQSEHVIIFTPAPIELDLRTIAGNIGHEARVLKAELDSLHGEHGDFSHLWYVRPSNELRRCAPLPAGETPGAPGGSPDDADAPGSTPGAGDLERVESAPCEESDSASARS